MITFESSDVLAIRTSRPLLPISSLPGRLGVCFLGTLLTIRGIAALISLLVESSSLGTWSSTSRISLSPLPPLRPLIPSWTPCFLLTRWPSHLFLFTPFQQVLLVHRHHFRWSLPRHARPRCTLPRHARPRCPLPRHARPRCPLPRHARPRRPLPRHARPRSSLPRHARPRSPLLSPLASDRSTAVGWYLLRHHHLRHLHQPRRPSLGPALVWIRRSTTRLTSIGIPVTLIPW
jgi:hypothetical protein